MSATRTCFLCVVVLSSLGAISCQPRSRAEVDRIIAGSEKLSRMDRACQSLRRPDDFVELRKGIFGNSDKSSITYQYKMSGSIDSVVEHFKKECEGTDCSVISEYDRKDFRRNTTLNLQIERVRIQVEYQSRIGSLVNFSCSM